MQKTDVIVSTSDLHMQVMRYLNYYNAVTGVMDIRPFIEHEVDCQLYGSMYRDFSRDDLSAMLVDLSIPTDYQIFIKKYLQEGVEHLLDRYVGSPKADYTYVSRWIGPSTCIVSYWPDPKPENKAIYFPVPEIHYA